VRQGFLFSERKAVEISFERVAYAKKPDAVGRRLRVS